MPHESRLQQSLRELLITQRTAALAVQPLADFSAPALPAPGLSFVPWAWCSDFSCLVIHVSGLASHTSAMQAHPAISLMMVAAEVPGQGVHALERISIAGVASTPPLESALWQAAKSCYLARFPEAEAMTMLGDFRFICITPSSGRHVAGFGAAREVSDQDLIAVFNPASP
ncbi:MAG: pyridoxamine 5'-phosphate oxidase [Comamonas sp.]